MKTTWIRSTARAMMWAGIVVMFVASSLLVASCQEKQDTSLADRNPVEDQARPVTGKSTATRAVTVAATEPLEISGSVGEPATPSAADEPAVRTDGDSETQEPVSAVEYVVANGDNLWTISRRFYHTHVYWKLLADWNGIEDPADLRLEQVLTIPPVDDFPYRLYLVREGDNLMSVSRLFYNTGDRWEALAEANELASANRIHEGLILKIPPLETSATPADSSLLASE